MMVYTGVMQTTSPTPSPQNPTRWGTLKRGDSIVCPGTGRTERVVNVSPSVKGRTFVRTNHHDHNRPSSETVEMVRADPEADLMAAFARFNARRRSVTDPLTEAAEQVRIWTRKRDRLIREARASGLSLRAVAVRAKVSHTSVKTISEQVPSDS